jgi:hypothetical protein
MLPKPSILFLGRFWFWFFFACASTENLKPTYLLAPSGTAEAVPFPQSDL